MNRSLAVVAVLVLAAAPLAGQEPSIADIMARDYAGTSPTDPRWSHDGKALYYDLERPGSGGIFDTFRVDPATGRTSQVDDADLGAVDPSSAVWSRDRRTKAFVRAGDLFYRDRRGRLHQVTRTGDRERSPLVLVDGRIAWRRGDSFFAFDPETGTTSTLFDLRLADEPDDAAPSGFYGEQQQRYFEVLRQARERREAAKAVDEARRDADPTRAPEPWFLGRGQALRGAVLSPDGRRLLVELGPARDLSEDAEQGADGGKPDKMPRFVTESGYVEIADVRPKVGTGAPETAELRLLDLATRESTTIDLSDLPGRSDDPLAELRAAVAKADDEESAAPANEPRVLSVGEALWTDDGTRLAVMLFSYDNKDRWLVSIDPATGAVETLDRDSDPAWINWRFNDFGWMRDGETVWFLSEESGFSHLWLRPLDGPARQLTDGRFEVDTPVLSRDGRRFFVAASREAPGIVEAYAVDARSGAMTRLTRLGGLVERLGAEGRGWGADLRLSPDEKRLAFLGSTLTVHPELYVQETKPGATAKRLTDTMSDAYEAGDWVEPEIVSFPSTHGAGTVWARVYTPPDWVEGERYPAIAWVHGAGYLQDVHHGWSTYEREFLFHTLLAKRGYVVISVDYRGSSGYGRDWRTAIYRQMGWPEVEDYEDGIDWLVANRGVDRDRIGVFGGSYGGFFTFMAMFTKPHLFQAGAALRPVTDWAHYNHGYTSNILNTPEVDPEAYRKSSPIEYAEGLEKPLVILHGMVDDNVVFQDSVRLVQRLIELGKTDFFETAIYPVEPHSFKEPTSWTDEYRRIWNLFERTLW